MRLVEQLSPSDRVLLIKYIADTLYDEMDNEEDEELAQEAEEVLKNTPEDGWLDWEDVKAELMRAEAAGELPRQDRTRSKKGTQEATRC